MDPSPPQPPPAGGAGMSKPPPRSTKKSKTSLLVSKVARDKEAMDKARQLSEGVLFFDHQSESVRRRREVARQVFEDMVMEVLGNENASDAEIWNKETICERTHNLMFAFASIATGRISDKPKVGVLYQMKDSLYWWIIRFIPDFFPMFATWHHTTNSAIHKAALEYEFERGSREKSNLTDAELELFWQQIQKPATTGRANCQQHFIAWLLVWVTSARPGSFAVAYGYEKGSRVAPGFHRDEAETMRWSDLEFMRVDEAVRGGICVVINFKFEKNMRVPHQNKSFGGARKFTIMPLRSNRYHFDLALQLTALAFSRGLFSKYDTLEDLFAGDERSIARDEGLKQQAVFLSSDQTGELTKEPMPEKALNEKLQDMCRQVGLLGRNTIYGFRRGAIIDTRRKQGTEISQELANHVMGGGSIYHYDAQGLLDMDVANQRNNLEAFDRAEIRKMMSQATATRVSNPVGMAESIKKRALDMSRTDPEFTNIDNKIRDQYAAAKALLMSLAGLDGDLMKNHQDIRDQLSQHSATLSPCQDALSEIDSAVQERLKTLRRLQTSHSKEISSALLAEAKSAQKASTSKNRAGTRGQFSRPERNAMMTGGSASDEGSFDQVITDLEAFDPDASGVAEDDASENEDEEQDHTRDEPSEWQDLPVDVTVQFAQGEDPSYTDAGRLNAAKGFLQFVQGALRNTNLTCIQCNLDDTVPYDKKKLTYNLANLDIHLKGSYHSRDNQLMRGFHIALAASDKKSVVPCPLCGKNLKASGFTSHVEDEHDWQYDF